MLNSHMAGDPKGLDSIQQQEDFRLLHYLNLESRVELHLLRVGKFGNDNGEPVTENVTVQVSRSSSEFLELDANEVQLQ